VNLEGVQLQEADLCEGDLREARVRDACFCGANLQDADLTDAVGLSGRQLAGANVAGAKLPQAVAKFPALQQVQKVSEFAQRAFLLMLTASLYALLTMVSTNDVLLLTNSSSLVLPSVTTPIPTFAFYSVGPFILLAVFGYCHFYLQTLWQTLAGLPAILPDGRRLDEAVHPWVLSGPVRVRLGRWRGVPPPLESLRSVATVLAAWAFVPGLLLYYWWRYLPRHDWLGTGLHLVAIPLAGCAAVWLHTVALLTLRSDGKLCGFWRCRGALGPVLWRRGARVLAIALLLTCISFFAIGRLPFAMSGWRPWIKADFRGRVVSEVPAGWTGKNGQLELVKGVVLAGQDLRCLQAADAVLVKSQFRKADLRDADLAGADLRGAKLSEALLGRADLSRALLQDADLTGATLTRAKLLDAELHKAQLVSARLETVDLTGAQLVEAKLQSAVLTDDANLRTAVLRKAELNRAQAQGAHLEGATLDDAILSDAHFEGAYFAGASLKGAVLSLTHLEGADLRTATGLTQEQLDQAITDQETQLPPGLKRRGQASRMSTK
jgi:uncharacterized protein YjbI with pentapeptide repeats